MRFIIINISSSLQNNLKKMAPKNTCQFCKRDVENNDCWHLNLGCSPPCSKRIMLCKPHLKSILECNIIAYKNWTEGKNYQSLRNDNNSNNLECKFCHHSFSANVHNCSHDIQDPKPCLARIEICEKCLISIFDCNADLFNFWIKYNH